MTLDLHFSSPFVSQFSIFSYLYTIEDASRMGESISIVLL